MEKSQTVEFMFVVCGDGGKGPVLTNPLVKLRLDTEESLEIVTGEVQVGHVTANNVWTNLSSTNFLYQQAKVVLIRYLLDQVGDEYLRVLLSEAEDGESVQQLPNILLKLVTIRLLPAFLSLLPAFALSLFSSVRLDVIQHCFGSLLLTHLPQPVVL